jgi:hypothetical protein
MSYMNDECMKMLYKCHEDKNNMELGRRYVDMVVSKYGFERDNFGNALYNGITSIIKIVIDKIKETGNNIFKNIDPDCSVNVTAAELGNYDVVKLLLDSKLDSNDTGPFYVYLHSNDIEGLKFLVKNRIGLSSDHNVYQRQRDSVFEMIGKLDAQRSICDQKVKELSSMYNC